MRAAAGIICHFSYVKEKNVGTRRARERYQSCSEVIWPGIRALNRNHTAAQPSREAAGSKSPALKFERAGGSMNRRLVAALVAAVLTGATLVPLQALGAPAEPAT